MRHGTIRKLAALVQTDPAFAQMLRAGPVQALATKRHHFDAGEFQLLNMLDAKSIAALSGPMFAEDVTAGVHNNGDDIQHALPATKWGLLANIGFEGTPLKSVFFFTGSRRDGVQRYHSSGCDAWPCVPESNTVDYTRRPEAAGNLLWSDDDGIHQDEAIDEMVSTGFNVIEMSYWGPPGTRNWAYYAPMQTNTCSNDELVNRLAAREDVLFIPWVEGVMDTVMSCDLDPTNGKRFYISEDFPALTNLTERVADLVSRYIYLTPNLAAAWAQIYDSTGIPRFAIALGNLSATDSQMTDEVFIKSLLSVANTIYAQFHVRIGFVLDDLGGPTGPDDPSFYLTPAKAAPWIKQTPAILAIRPYRSEWRVAWDGEYAPPDARVRLFDAKRNLAIAWLNEGIPFIQDLTTGYDGHLVFSENPRTYGNSDEWRNDQAAIRGLGQIGIAYTAWNGYTEGWIGMPAKEPDYDGAPGDTWNRWLRVMLSRDPRECYFVPFQNGEPTSDVVYGAICEKWVQSAGTRGALGSPISTEVDGFSPGARWTAFENGVIFWHPSLGAHEVHGLIAHKYYTYANPPLDGGPLGLPISDEQPIPLGRMSQFEHGVIVWSPGAEPQVFID